MQKYKIIVNMEMLSSIITWHKIAANKWSNTVEQHNCRSTTVTMGTTLVEATTEDNSATLVGGVTLEIGKQCTCRRRNSVDRLNTRGRRNIGDLWPSTATVEGTTLEIGEWCNSRRCNSVDW